MAHIPDGAHWHLADLVIEISVEGDPRNVVHINIHLIEAGSPEQAYEKAVALGFQSETTYINSAGREVRVRFRGLRELNVIHDELVDGAELTFEQQTAVPESELAGWVHARERLAVFRETGPEAGVPNYMPESIEKRLRKAGFDPIKIGDERSASRGLTLHLPG